MEGGGVAREGKWSLPAGQRWRQAVGCLTIIAREEKKENEKDYDYDYKED
jgi:hypothetical protein